VTLHQKANPKYEIYHLSAGTQAQTFRELTDNLAGIQKKRKPVYMPALERPVTSMADYFSQWKGSIGLGASLLKVFLPYLVWNTVFDNSRVVSEMGRVPAPFSQYSYPLLKFSQEHHFTYQYR